MVFKSQIPDSIPPSEYKDLVSNFFWHQLDKFSSRTLFVNYETGREWTGHEIKRDSKKIAQALIQRVGLQANDNCLLFYKNCDYIHITSLAILFAGGSVCVGEPEDPEREQEYMLALMLPNVVFICNKLIERMRALRDKLQLNFKLIIMDDDDQENCQFQASRPDEFGLHTHLLSAQMNSADGYEDKIELPIQVDKDRPAFVLFTSGSTGDPKAVNRSQRNSLYVCFSFPEESSAHLWDLNESSIVAGHIQLDHGTGSFCLKMTLAKGLKLIIMKRYKCSKLLDAIQRYKITDCILGSALLHNFITAHLEQPEPHNLSSLRNLIATGSPIVSRDRIKQFAERYPNCSARQSFGMTELGFMTFVERDRALTCQSVGVLLPNLQLKLIDPKTGSEIEQFDEEGELHVWGPSLSPGYLGERFREHSRRAFEARADGFYRGSDIAAIQVDSASGDPIQRLVIKGRYSEVLLLYDGWKVLPSELEQLLQEHPRVLEAAVVGVPHPELPTCHAPRAYVTLRRQNNGCIMSGHETNGYATNGHSTNGYATNGYTNEQDDAILLKELADFVAERTSEPKHLIGGVKIVKELPRLSIGKVDKKLLKQQDGFA